MMAEDRRRKPRVSDVIQGMLIIAFLEELFFVFFAFFAINQPNTLK